MTVASGGSIPYEVGPTAMNIFMVVFIVVSVLVVTGYYGQKLQWWLQDRRKAKEASSRSQESSGGT